MEELGFATDSAETDNMENNEILSALKDAGRPLALDEIIEITGLETGETAALLAMLSINKMVLETPAGYILGK